MSINYLSIYPNHHYENLNVSVRTEIVGHIHPPMVRNIANIHVPPFHTYIVHG